MSNPNNAAIFRWLAFITASLFFLYEFVARIEPSLAATDISRFLGLSNTGFGILVSLFFWIYAPMQLVVGLALDRYGVRRTVVPAILFCALGTALFAATDWLALTAAARLLTGLGASFAFVGALYVVNHQFAPERFAVLSGIVNATGMLGAAIGAVALSSAIEVSGWRNVFLISGAAGLGLFLLALLFLHGVRDAEARNDNLLSPLRTVLSSPRIWLIAVLGALYYMPVNVFGGLWGQQEMIKDHGLSPVQAETAISMIYWGMAAGSITAGLISDWLGHRKWLVVISALLAANCCAVVYRRFFRRRPDAYLCYGQRGRARRGIRLDHCVRQYDRHWWRAHLSTPAGLSTGPAARRLCPGNQHYSAMFAGQRPACHAGPRRTPSRPYFRC